MRKEKIGLLQVITEGNSMWRKSVESLQERYDISDEQLSGEKESLKKIIADRNTENFLKFINDEATQKSKVKHWFEMNNGIILEGRETYLDRMSRRQCSNIIKVRGRMLPAKANHPGSHNNRICRLCAADEETQKHILTECTTARKVLEKIPYTSYFIDTKEVDMEAIATNIRKATELLENI